METYDLEGKTIKDINNQILFLENRLEYYLDKKAKAFDLTQPKAVVYDKETTEGGLKRENKFECYVISNEELDPIIDFIQNEICRLVKFVNKELLRIEKYEPLKKQIIELREIDKLKWQDISRITDYCESQCRNIYRDYKKKRNI